MANDELEIESVADDYRKEKKDPLEDIPSIGSGNKKPSLMGKVSSKVNELKERYSSYQAMQKERQKQKAMKAIERANEEREIRLLENRAAKESYKNKELQIQTKEYQKKVGGSNPLASLGQGIRSFSSSRKAFKGGNSSGSSLLSGGFGGGSGLLSQGLGGKSSLLSGGVGGKSKLLSGGIGGKSKLLSGGMGGKGMSLTLGKGKGLKL